MDEYRVDHFFEEVEKANNEAVSSMAGSVSTNVIEIKDPELLSQIKEMFNGAEEALRRWAYRSVGK